MEFNGLNEILTRPKYVYETSYTFDACYQDIKDIFEEVDMVFGHTTYGDVKGLNDEFERYELESIEFNFYDIQEIYQKLFNKDKSTSLVDILKELDIYGADNAHDAEADAFNTMLALKEICNKTMLNAEELTDRFPSCKDHTKDFIIDSTTERLQKQEEFFLSNLTGDDTNKMFSGSYNRKKFNQFVDNLKPSNNGVFLNQVITFDSEYEQNNYSQMLNLVKLISNAGGRYVNNALTANVFVNKDKYDKNGKLIVCSKYNYFMNRDLSKLTILSFDKLLEMLGLSEKELDEMPRPSFEFLFNDDVFIKSDSEREVIQRIKKKELLKV